MAKKKLSNGGPSLANIYEGITKETESLGLTDVRKTKKAVAAVFAVLSKLPLTDAMDFITKAFRRANK